MVVYLVHWFYDSGLTKGKGRLCDKEKSFGFTVLCRDSKDAISCLEWYFDNVFHNPKKLSLDVGTVTLKRTIIDSRGFNPNYMLMDGMKQPLDLSNVKHSINRMTLLR